MARIIAIVDVFEALTSERPYRSPMPPQLALQYVRKGAGTQFDPNLVPLFEALYQRGDIQCAADQKRGGAYRVAPDVDHATDEPVLILAG